MARHWNDKAEETAVGDDLEPYRRLVDLQKQMIELAQQHEEAKRRRDAAHEEMVRDVANRRRHRRGWRQHLQQSAVRLLKCVPGFAAEKTGSDPVNDKPSLPC